MTHRREDDCDTMGFFDQLKTRMAGLQATATTEVAKFKSKDFAKASMAMCALIAAADASLYRAKQLGRDRIIIGETEIAA